MYLSALLMYILIYASDLNGAFFTRYRVMWHTLFGTSSSRSGVNGVLEWKASMSDHYLWWCFDCFAQNIFIKCVKFLPLMRE